jgi:hypothetical protein
MLLDGKDPPQAIETYKAAKRLSEALGFSYRPADELARRPLEEIARRLAKLLCRAPPPLAAAC